MKRLIVCNKKRKDVEVVFDKSFDETLTVEELAKYMSKWNRNISVNEYEDQVRSEEECEVAQ